MLPISVTSSKATKYSSVSLLFILHLLRQSAFSITRKRIFSVTFFLLHCLKKQKSKTLVNTNTAFLPSDTFLFFSFPSPSDNQPYFLQKQTIPLARTHDSLPKEHVPLTRFPFPVSRYPFPVSRYPFPVSRYPVPLSRFPLPLTRFPLPLSRFPIPLTRFPIPLSRFHVPVTRFHVPVTRF
jgi:hypothetical protein